MGSLLSWLDPAAPTIEKIAAAQKPPTRRPAPPPRRAARRVQPAQALGLTGASPFAPSVRQSRTDVRRAASKLPGHPSLREIAKGYDDSLTAVFDHQPKTVQQRIIRTAITKPSPDGNTILSHVSGFRGSQLRAHRDQLAWLAAKQHSDAFDWLGHAAATVGSALKRGLTPNTSEIESALADPSGFRGSVSGFNHPDIAQLAELQGVGNTVSGKLNKLIDLGEQRGVLGARRGGPAALGSDVGGQVALAALRDAANLPREAIPGVAIPVSQAASGHIGQAARSAGQGYIDFAHDPIGTLRDHPLDSFLMASGVEGVIGRGLGAAARSDLAPAAVRAAASTRRASLELAPGQSDARHYSPNLFHKAAQVGYERRLARRGLDPNRARPLPPLLDSHLTRALGLGQEAKLNRVVDEMSAVHQLATREHRATIKQARHSAAPNRGVSSPEANVVSLAVQRVLRKPETFAQDLAKERDRLKAAYDSVRGTPEGVQNRKQVRDIERVLHDPEALANAHEVFRSAQAYIDDRIAIDRRSGIAGAIDDARAEKAAHFPYAIAHMEATYGRFTPREHLAAKAHEARAAEALDQARVGEHEALRAHRSAVRELVTARGRAGVAQGRAEVIARRAGMRAHPDDELTQIIRDGKNPVALGHAVDEVLRRRRAELDAIRRGQPVSHGAPAHQRTLVGLERERARLLAAERAVASTTARAGDAVRARKNAEADVRDARAARFGTSDSDVGLLWPDGSPLTLAEIKAHMKDHGDVSAPGFLQHRLDTAGSGSFYQPYRLSRARSTPQVRTGAAFRAGAYDHTHAALVGDHVRAAGILDRLALHDKLVNRAGIGRADLGRLLDDPPSPAQAQHDPYFTPAEARAVAYAYTHDEHGNRIPGRIELSPVTAFAKRGASREQLDAIGSAQHPSELAAHDGLEAHALEKAMQDAEARRDGTRNVLLVPSTQVERFLQQYQGSSRLAKVAGRVTQQFRRTVLPYSTHWMTQNQTEGILRGLIRDNFNPLAMGNHYRLARQFFKQSLATDAAKAADIKREAVGGTLYNRHDPLARFNPDAGPVRAFLETNRVARRSITPVIKRIERLHNWYADNIGALQHVLETQYRMVGVGKKVQRDMQEFTDSWIQAVHGSRDIMQAVVEHHHADAGAVADLGRYVDDAFGKYQKLSPTVRALVQSAAPFLTWYINAAKFVYWTLPHDHPVKMAVLASAETALANDLRDGHRQPLSRAVAEAAGRLTPFGIGTEADSALGSFEQEAAAAFVPQLMGAVNIFSGQNVFGDGPLTGPNGRIVDPGGRAWLAINALAEGLMPGLSIARTVREHGRRAYDSSTVFAPHTKPGPGYGTLNKLLNPFHSFSPPWRHLGGSGVADPGGLSGPSGVSGPGGVGDPAGITDPAG